MTDLRTAAQQALEYLDAPSSKLWPAGTQHRIITALKAALAEPQQEPFEYWNAVEGWVKLDEVRQHFDSVGCGTIYKTAGEDRVPLYISPQPVAKVELMLTGGNAGLATRIVEIDDHLRERLCPGQLLYTTPPQRKPLTDEEIGECLPMGIAPHSTVVGRREIMRFARAIERAHGIKDAGCDHCRHPLYAATKCNNCGRATARAEDRTDWSAA